MGEASRTHTHIVTEIFRLVDEQLEPFAPVGDVFDVLHHNVLQLVNLAIDAADRVLLLALVELAHLCGERTGELGVHRVRNRGRHGQPVHADEPLVDVLQKEEGTGSIEALSRESGKRVR